MKLIKKFLGIAAIIAVIGFMVLPLTGCPDEESLPPPPPPPPPKSTPTAADFDIHGLTHKYEAEITEYKVTITPKAGKSTGTITAYYEGTDGKDYAKSTNAPSDLGKYAVTFDVAAADGWNPASGLTAGTMLVTDTLFTPEAGHFDITGISVTYDGSPKSVTITAQTGKTEGTVTIYYEGTGGTTYTKSATAPTNAGTYAVTFDVSESDAWAAGTGLSKGTLTIDKATPALADYDIGNEKLLQVANNNANPIAEPITATVKTTGLRSDGAVTVFYEGASGTTYARSASKPGAKGTYAVTFDVAETPNWKPATINPAKTLTLNIFESIASLGTTLSSAGTNTAATAYPVELNVDSFGGTTTGSANQAGSVGATLLANLTKYVSLDLSGSTFTAIPNVAFAVLGETTNACTNLVSVTIGNNVTSIGNSVFNGCASLAGVTIGNNVTSIGAAAFNGCTSLPGITIPNSVTSIGVNAFSGCTSLASVTLPTNASFTSIGNFSFNGCTSLASITIPNSVTSIGERAFQGCTSLAIVTIPNSVTTIGTSAFEGCGLTSVTFATTSKVTTIGEQAFMGCTELTSITIPNSVTSIGDTAFSHCGLTSVTLPTNANFTSISQQAFIFCTSLASITIPSNVTSIGERAFAYSNLNSVTFATGSNIPDANFGTNAFPEDKVNPSAGDILKTAYSTGKAGTYKWGNGTWTKQP